jgi:hypothetical protein
VTDKGTAEKGIPFEHSQTTLNNLLPPCYEVHYRSILTMSIPLIDLSNPNIEELAEQVKDVCSVIPLGNNCSNVRPGDSCTSRTLEFQDQQ